MFHSFSWLKSASAGVVLGPGGEAAIEPGQRRRLRPEIHSQRQTGSGDAASRVTVLVRQLTTLLTMKLLL